jgi:hypothetical protein
MGSTKIQTESGGTTTTQPTEAEKKMQELQLAQYQQVQPQQTEMMQNAYNLGNQLLTSFGGQDNPQWKSLIGGVTPEQQQSMISEQDRYLQPQLQQAGLWDSGTAASVRFRAATDLANQNAQFNVGTLQNALNLALSGQAQVQAPVQGASSQLANQLAGLRSITTTGYSSQSNPFKGVNLGKFGTWGGY